MTKTKDDGYVDAVHARMEGDVLKAMLEVMARRVMEEEIARHLGTDRHERTSERKRHPDTAVGCQGLWTLPQRWTPRHSGEGPRRGLP